MPTRPTDLLRRSHRRALFAAVAVLVAFVAAATAIGSRAVAGTTATPSVDVTKPAFVVTSRAGLERLFSDKQVDHILVLAGRYGDVYDVDKILDSGPGEAANELRKDPFGHAEAIDDVIEKHFRAEQYSCILVVGGHGVVPMPQIPNPAWGNESGDWVDEDVVYTDDVYGDLDHDHLPDVPVARIPDGKDYRTIVAQLRGTQAPESRGMVLYNEARPGAVKVGATFGADTLVKVPPNISAELSPDLRSYYIILHGSERSATWTADDLEAEKSVVGLRARHADVRGVVWSSACYGAYMIDESADDDVGLHFLKRGCRAYIASTAATYSAAQSSYDVTSEGGFAAAFFKAAQDGKDPLLAFFQAKRQFAATGQNETDGIHWKTVHEFNYFGMPFTPASSAGTAGDSSTTPSAPSASGRSDTMLVMDVSGSMGDEMSGTVKLDAAKSAADAVVSMVRDETMAQSSPNLIGLVSFSEGAAVAQPLGADFTAASRAIGDMAPQSGTNVGDGLDTGLGALYGSPKGDTRMIVLLSDGQTNTGMTAEEILSGPVATAAAAGIRIYTVGFGDSGDIDEELLRRIAAQTGGTYYFADESFQLQNIYIRMRHEAAGDVLGDFSGTANGELEEAGRFAVDAVTGELRGTLNATEGSAKVVLRDPDGRRVDNQYPGAMVFARSKPAYVIVKNPKPGSWTVSVRGSNQASYDVVVSAKGTRHEPAAYSRLLVIVALAAGVVALAAVATSRWPLRVG